MNEITSPGVIFILDDTPFSERQEGTYRYFLTFTSAGRRFIEDQILHRGVGGHEDISLWSHLPTSRRSKTVFIADLGNAKVALLRSIPVAVDFWPDHVSACSFDIEEFGLGNDEFEAVTDLKASIVDLYVLLRNEQPNLGPLPRRQWEFLKGIIRET